MALSPGLTGRWLTEQLSTAVTWGLPNSLTIARTERLSALIRVRVGWHTYHDSVRAGL